MTLRPGRWSRADLRQRHDGSRGRAVGRRWITIDTSRVALALAGQRLLTAKCDCYKLKEVGRGVPTAPDGGSDVEAASVPLGVSGGDAASTNAEAYLDKMLRLLKADGVRFPNNKVAKFSRLEPVQGAELLHAEGQWSAENGRQRRAAVKVIDPHGNEVMRVHRLDGKASYQ